MSQTERLAASTLLLKSCRGIENGGEIRKEKCICATSNRSESGVVSGTRLTGFVTIIYNRMLTVYFSSALLRRHSCH